MSIDLNFSILEERSAERYVKIFTSFSLFCVLRRSSTVPFGSLAKAAAAGAKTVNGPSPLRRYAADVIPGQSGTGV